MNTFTLQIHAQGQWHDVASVALWGDAAQTKPAAPAEPHSAGPGLAAMVPVLAQLAEHGPAMGLEPDVHAHLQPGLHAMAARMHVLAG